MTYKDIIKTIVLSGGKVTFSYKKGLLDWISDVYIFTSFEFGKIIVSGGAGDEFSTKDIDKAIDYFASKVFSKSNMYLAFDGMRKHGIIKQDEEIDCEYDKNLPKKIKRYFDEYYDLDFLNGYPRI